MDIYEVSVLVPFYRGAVVFFSRSEIIQEIKLSSRPLLSRSGCILKEQLDVFLKRQSSRPLLSRSGCIYGLL